MKIHRLTQATIKNILQSTINKRYCDGGGLYLNKRGNSLLYEFRYIRKDGKQSYMSIGSYYDIDLKTARDKAQELRKNIFDGVDILLERKKQNIENNAKQFNTFKAITMNWLETQQDRITYKTIADKYAKLRMYVFPTIADVAIQDVSVALVRAITDKLAELEKFETLKRTLVNINGVLNHAVYLGLISHNPCLLLSRAYKKPNAKPLACLPPHQLQLLITTFKNANIDELSYLLFLWQLHTMTRPSEAVKAQFSEIDEKRKLWIIPSHKMKMRKEHIIPLTKYTIELLERIKLYSFGSDYLFNSARTKSGHMSKEILIRIISRTDLKGLTTAHGFRSLASTILNEQRYDYDLIEKSLAHNDSDKIRSIYNRAEYIEKRREMLTWWGSQISKFS